MVVVLNEIEMFNIGDNDNPTTRHEMKNTILACSCNFLRFQIRDGVAVTAFPHSIKIF